MAYYYLGIIYDEDGEGIKALKNYETALTGFPKSSDINLRIAKLLDANNKKKEADNYYLTALSYYAADRRYNSGYFPEKILFNSTGT